MYGDTLYTSGTVVAKYCYLTRMNFSKRQYVTATLADRKDATVSKRLSLWQTHTRSNQIKSAIRNQRSINKSVRCSDKPDPERSPRPNLYLAARDATPRKDRLPEPYDYC